MSETMSANWFFALQGQQHGPVSLGDLQQRVAAGQLTGVDLVWQEGMPQWQPVNTLPHLFTVAQTPLNYAAPVSYNYGAQVEYVGFWWRVLAYIIDSIVTGIVGAIAGFIVGLVVGMGMGPGGAAQQTAEWIAQGVGIIIGWLYWALMESSAQQATLGKMAIGVIVTDLAGNRISFGRATGRHFAKILSALILCIGYIMVAFTEKKQGLHDQIANTLVVKKRT